MIVNEISSAVRLKICFKMCRHVCVCLLSDSLKRGKCMTLLDDENLMDFPLENRKFGIAL